MAQVRGIRPVVYDGEMIVRPPRIVGTPPDNGQVVASHFERWPLGDLDAHGFLRRRRWLSRRTSLTRRMYLSDGGGGGEQAADHGRER